MIVVAGCSAIAAGAGHRGIRMAANTKPGSRPLAEQWSDTLIIALAASARPERLELHADVRVATTAPIGSAALVVGRAG
jgi:hypothetical protein